MPDVWGLATGSFVSWRFAIYNPWSCCCLYVESDYYSRFIVACDKKIKGRYPGFDCSKIPVVTEERLREILKDIEQHGEFY